MGSKVNFNAVSVYLGTVFIRFHLASTGISLELFLPRTFYFAPFWAELKGTHLRLLELQIKVGCLNSQLAGLWGCSVSNSNSWNHSLGT